MTRNRNTRFALFTMLAALFMQKGLDKTNANKKAYHQSILDGGNGEFITNKHPKMSYSKQNRIAKKRKRVLAKSPK